MKFSHEARNCANGLGMCSLRRKILPSKSLRVSYSEMVNGRIRYCTVRVKNGALDSVQREPRGRNPGWHSWDSPQNFHGSAITALPFAHNTPAHTVCAYFPSWAVRIRKWLQSHSWPEADPPMMFALQVTKPNPNKGESVRLWDAGKSWVTIGNVRETARPGQSWSQGLSGLHLCLLFFLHSRKPKVYNTKLPPRD